MKINFTKFRSRDLCQTYKINLVAIFLLLIGYFSFGLSNVNAQLLSISPTTGPIGTTVTITGSGFNTSPAYNIVYFGAVKAPVLITSETSLTVTVPIGANFGPISVTNLGTNLTSYSSGPFTVTFPGGCKPEFAGNVDFPVQSVPTSVAIGDIDGDGKPDMAVANSESQSVTVLQNMSLVGSLSFPFSVNFTTSTQQHAYPGTVGLCDLDGDSRLDMIVSNNLSQFSSMETSKITVFRNTSSVGTINSGSFAAKQEFTASQFPVMVKFADIDGDGKPDMITAGLGGTTDGTSVFHNTSTPGNISFAPRVIFASGVPCSSVDVSDIDGDGKPDVVGFNYADGKIMVFHNTATPGVLNSSSLAPNVSFNWSGGTGTDLTIGDINGDGKPDVVLASSVYLNTSTAGTIDSSSLAPQVIFHPSGSNAFVPEIGDLDGDGMLDVMNTFTQHAGGGGILVYHNNSSLSEINFAGEVNFMNHVYYGELAIGDLDGDGKPDMAIGSDINTVSVFRNTATPSYLQTAAYGNGILIPNGSLTTDSLNLTDFGDVSVGRNLIHDFTFQNSSSDSLIIDNIIIQGPDSASFSAGSFTPAGKIAPGNTVTIPINYSPSSLGPNTATVKINSAINTDNLCYAEQTYSFVIQGSATYGIPLITSFSPGSGPVGSSVTISGGGFNSNPSDNIVFFGSVKAPVIAANPLELTVTVPTGASYDYITVTTPGNNLTGYSPLPFIVTFSACPSPKFAFRKYIPAIFHNYFVSGSDFDGDGKPDIAVSNPDSNSVSVLLNTSEPGSINFALKVDFPVNGQPQSITIGDYDGDGKPDIAFVKNVASSPSTISVLLNTSVPGVISFAPVVDFQIGFIPTGASTADFNGDGKPDLAVSIYGDQNVTVFLNTSSSEGSISFAPGLIFGTGGNTRFVTTGDIDGDGKSDIIAANGTANKVIVMRNISTDDSILFAARVSFATGSNAYIVNAGDLDGDGKLDLAISNNSDVSASVLRNTSTPGSISFDPKIDFTTESHPTYVAISDVNGDGKPDMITANTALISVFSNTSTAGAISFESRVNFQTGTDLVNSISTADLDGDSKPDLAVNSYGDRIVVLRNKIQNSEIITEASGNGNPIADGSTEPSLENYTDFGSIGVSDDLIRTYTFRNNGIDSIEIVSIYDNGTDEDLFTTGTLNPPGEIAPGESANFNVSFSPESIGLKSTTVYVVAINECTQETYSFAIQGTGASIMNIKVIPQGYFNTASGQLNMRDTVRAYLMEDFSPFNVVDSAIAVIDSVTFNGKFYFSNAPKGEYYIKIRQRNTIETWSRTGGEVFIEGGVMGYNFTNELLKAYGNNMIRINTSPDLFGIFSGDVNQDGEIDLDDVLIVFNDAENFVTGYVSSDLYGEGFVDVDDVILSYNNSVGFAMKLTP